MSIQTSWVDPYLEMLESRDPKCFKELLQEMVNCPSVHEGLVQNSTTPAAILSQVIKKYKDPNSVPAQILANPNCPRGLIDEFIEKSSDDAIQLKMIAANETLNREDLKKLISQRELAPILTGRTNLPADFFIYIWENFLVDLKDAAFNLNLPLLKALACNPKTPLKILRNLSKYEVIDYPGLVKSLLMSNPALPSDLKAHYALLGFEQGENVLDKNNTDWYPTNGVFAVDGFSDHLLIALADLGHPGGYLRTDVIPPENQAMNSNAIFDLWISDQSIYKTLWPELKGVQGPDFWYSHGGTGFTFFGIEGVHFEHSERQDDGELNYHAIPDSPTWLPYEIDYSDALSDFKYNDFQDVADSGVLEWAEAWNLSNFDPDYISLVDTDDLADKFMWDQHMDIAEYMDEGLWFIAKVDDELCRPYSWKVLSLSKKSFLIEFISSVYLSAQDGYWQYAEHFLVCICLNPFTEDELIQKHFVDKSLGSDLVEQALKVRKRVFVSDDL
jgi:hypothetical protein